MAELLHLFWFCSWAMGGEKENERVSLILLSENELLIPLADFWAFIG